MKVLAFVAIAALVACREATAPAIVQREIRSGPCTVWFKYWVDRSDTTKGALVVGARYEDGPDTPCPDSVWTVWDQDQR